MLFALIAAGLWIVNSLYSIGYMRANAEVRQTRFFACFALALAATMGIAFAANVFTLFVFYEMLTLVTYPLVTHHGTEEARRAGRIYLGLLLGTSIMFLLPALVVHVVCRRHHRLQARRNPGRQARCRGPRRSARALHVRHRQGRADALSSLAAGGDGRADAGVGAAARGGGRQGRRVQRRQGHRLRVRHRHAARRRRQRLAGGRRRLHDRGGVGGRAEAPTT